MAEWYDGEAVAYWLRAGSGIYEYRAGRHSSAMEHEIGLPRSIYHRDDDG